MNIKRTEWVSTLNALPCEQLLSITEKLSERWEIYPRAIPQSGLGMLKLNDSAFEEAFFLGEFPLSSAWIEILTPEDISAEGAAQVMSDRVEIAEALAVCDAILSAQLPGYEQVSLMLEQGLAIRKQLQLERKQMLSSTRVDFSLLDEAGLDDMELSEMGDI